MKTNELVIKKHSSYSKKCEIPQYSVNWQQKLNCFEIILKNQPTKRENIFEKANQISFVTWAKTQNPYFAVFVISLTRMNFEQLSLCCSLIIEHWANNPPYVAQNPDTPKNFEKMGKLTTHCHSQGVKFQHCCRGNQRCSLWISTLSDKIRADSQL